MKEFIAQILSQLPDLFLIESKAMLQIVFIFGIAPDFIVVVVIGRIVCRRREDPWIDCFVACRRDVLTTAVRIRSGEAHHIVRSIELRCTSRVFERAHGCLFAKIADGVQFRIGDRS